MAIHEKSCVPCQGGLPPMSAEVAAQWGENCPDWQIRDDATRLFRSFEFRDYAEALDFVNRISAIAEREGHHPDLCLGWGYVTVTLYTHKIQGLHENDFLIAAKIDWLLASSDN